MLEALVMTDAAWTARADWQAWTAQARRTALVSAELFRGLCSLESPVQVGALVSLPQAPSIQPGVFTVVLDRLQDAGNVGSILRSAAAFGARQVLALKGTGPVVAQGAARRHGGPFRAQPGRGAVGGRSGGARRAAAGHQLPCRAGAGAGRLALALRLGAGP
jgi:hypothetical protein